MNKRDAGLQVGRNRLILIFCFFCIKTKEKYTVFEPFNLQIYFDKTDILIKTDDFIFFEKNILMKTRVRHEQKRCSVAGGGGSFVLDFLFLLYQDKRKIHSF